MAWHGKAWQGKARYNELSVAGSTAYAQLHTCWPATRKHQKNAWSDALSHGPSWKKRALEGLRTLHLHDATLAQQLQTIAPDASAYNNEKRVRLQQLKTTISVQA